MKLSSVSDKCPIFLNLPAFKETVALFFRLFLNINSWHISKTFHVFMNNGWYLSIYSLVYVGVDVQRKKVQKITTRSP